MERTKDRRGSEKLLSIWWFFVLVIIGGGIVIGLLIFYNADLDVRQVEADILTGKIMSCVNDNRVFREDIFSDVEKIYGKCGLNKEIIEKDFYFRISISDESGLIKEIKGGRSEFEEECDIENKVKAEKFPRCISMKENILFIDEGVREAELKVRGGSNNNGIRK